MSARCVVSCPGARTIRIRWCPVARGQTDLSVERHKVRNMREDYAWMIECGESHEGALKRLGMTPEEWEALRLAEQARDRRWGYAQRDEG